MPSPTHTFTGIIVGVAPRADKYTRWELLTSADGFCGVMSPVKLAMPFGVFDTVELVASSRGKNLFAQEVRLVHRPAALAQNLEAFTEAARLSNLVRAAFREMPDYKPVFDIFSRALEHYTLACGGAAPASPALVSLKAFYKMLAAEGFPVGQDWLAKLPSKEFTVAQMLLESRLSNAPEVIEEGAPPQNLSADFPVEKALESLVAWAARELGFKADARWAG